MSVSLGSMKPSQGWLGVHVDRPNPSPPPSITWLLYGENCPSPLIWRPVLAYLNRAWAIILQYSESLSQGPVKVWWYSLIIIINFNISLLHFPRRKSKLTLILGCRSACLELGPLAAWSCFPTLIWKFFATEQPVQPPVWLSQEPSDLSGLKSPFAFAWENVALELLPGNLAGHNENHLVRVDTIVMALWVDSIKVIPLGFVQCVPWAPSKPPHFLSCTNLFSHL
jgi:hypothetical protein